LNADTSVPPISTFVTIGSLKFVPVITTTHPVGPLVGENDEMVGGAANAGASRPSTTRTDTMATAATRGPQGPFEESHGSVLTSRKRYSPIRLAVDNGVRGLMLVLSQHPDEHRLERPILLAIDQQLGEGARRRPPW
jgi:hypothetical protein